MVCSSGCALGYLADVAWAFLFGVPAEVHHNTLLHSIGADSVDSQLHWHGIHFNSMHNGGV